MARVVVVGAGMGGMATAARLAVAGHRVTVLERGGRAGGAAGRFERDGFTFDTGPGLLWLPAVWRDLFIKTGKRPLEECVELRRVDPAAEHRFADGTRLRLPGFSRGGVGQALDEALGAGAGERWHALLGRARQTWEATRRPLVEEPLTSAAGRAALLPDPYPALPPRRTGLLRRRAPAQGSGLPAVAERELGDARLTALLAGTVEEYGIRFERAPASATVLAYVEQTFGTWYPVGGIAALVDAVRERCAERGVEFVHGAEARRILERDGKAAGVELADGERVSADHVVWSAPGLGAAPRGESRFTVLLALDGARPPGTAHRLLVHPADGGPVVRVLRPDDATLWPATGTGPAGHTAVVSALAPPQGTVDWREAATVERWTDRLLTAAGLENVRWHQVRTPLDIERETGMPGGVIPAPALAGADGELLAAPNAGRLPGAWRAGALAHPGGGLAHTGMSGALATGLIVEGPGWRGSY
ncbi:NAD(P)/FAD-dependent oxidoreductase [Streptomyces sp. JH002]|uniref:phytoene desaturase family protein n=1 Tax=Streptomyces sp. JH002 TaxID=2763259 RepID=UPI003D806A6B